MLRSSRRQLQASSVAPQVPVSSLEKWKAISSIASAIAIPFVLAVVGFFIQKQLADEGLKKDYVSIATNILKENPANQEPDLRKWAVDMLDSNSPIPFSRKAKEGLEKGIYFAVPPPRIPGPPEGCMKAPRPARIWPLVEQFSKKRIENAVELSKQYDQLIIAAVNAEGEAMEDRAALVCLQKYGKLVKQWDEELAEMHKKPISQWPSASAPSNPASAK